MILCFASRNKRWPKPVRRDEPHQVVQSLVIAVTPVIGIMHDAKPIEANTKPSRADTSNAIQPAGCPTISNAYMPIAEDIKTADLINNLASPVFCFCY